MKHDWAEFRAVPNRHGYFVNMLGMIRVETGEKTLLPRVYASTSKTAPRLISGESGLNPIIAMREAFPEFYGASDVADDTVFIQHKLFPWLSVQPKGVVRFCHPVSRKTKELLIVTDHNQTAVVDIPRFCNLPNIVVQVAELVMHVCTNDYRRHARMIYVDGDKTNCHIRNLRTERPLVDVDYAGTLPSHVRP